MVVILKHKLIYVLISLILAGCSNSSFSSPSKITPTLSLENSQATSSTKKEVYSISVSPNGKMLALSAAYGMQVYNLADGTMLYSFENKVPRVQGVYSQIAWSPDNNNIAIGTLNLGVRIWEVSKWKLLTEFGDEKAYTSAVFSHPGFAWSPKSENLILGINPTGLTTEDYKSGKLIVWDRKSNTWNVIKDNLNSISGVTWKSNNHALALGNEGIFDINTGDILGIADGYDYAIWSPDEKHLYGYFDLGGNLYDLESGSYEFDICCYAEVAWSMNGRYFSATPEGGNEINIWDSIENKLLSKEKQGEYIYAFAWTPKGELLVVGLKDGKNVVWNANTENVIMEIN